MGQIDIITVEEAHSATQLHSQVGAGKVTGDLPGDIGVGIAMDAGFGGKLQRIGTVGRKPIEGSNRLFGVGIGGKEFESHTG